MISKESKYQFVRYYDFDFVDSRIDKKSMSGSCLFLNRCLISLSFKK